MKRLLLFFFMLVGVQAWGQNDTLVFENPRQLANYAFSASNWQTWNSTFLTNRTLLLNDSIIASMSSPVWQANASSKKSMQVLTLLDWWDMSNTIHRDSILDSYMEARFNFDGEELVDYPLVFADVRVNSVLPSLWNVYSQGTTQDAFPPLQQSDLFQRDIRYIGFLEDTVPTNLLRLTFPLENIFSNQTRSISMINVTVGGTTFTLLPGSTIDLSNVLNGNTSFDFSVQFDDGTLFETQQNLYITPRPKSAFNLGTYSEQYEERLTVGASSGLNNPKIQYRIFYACADKKLRKPYIVFTGFGPHTDKGLINNNQGWPTDYFTLLNQFNVTNVFGELREKGFDIVFAQINPPNASTDLNTEVAIKVINAVNTRKNSDGYYEENIVTGYSAGALCARLALLKMEKRYLENNGKHPHTRLFISNDGENLGANVPLGLQHTFDYMMDYEYDAWNLKLYAINYIFNVPLAQELLYYFHTQTGSPSYPSQGWHPLRTSYLALQSTYNHSKNTHLQDYPSFQRNVSISNGSSIPEYVSGSVDHYPYPSEMGHIFLKQNNSFKRWEATFLKPGIHRVFYYEQKPLFKPWQVRYAAATINPLLLDNAPGGLFPFGEKPIVEQALVIFDGETPGEPNIRRGSQFSFTPTVFTHDVRNIGTQFAGGKLDYNFKVNKLMYDNENSASTNLPINASNFYGYPHLGYPSNHYTVTPFDALFTFDQNTEHLTGLAKSPTDNVGVPSAMQPVLVAFHVLETEGEHMYLQNRKVGEYTTAGASYRADFTTSNSITMGEHVTQKTDFLPVSFEANSISEVMAGTIVHLKPGVHLKAGADVHLFIGTENCPKSTQNTSQTGDSEEDAEYNYNRIQRMERQSAESLWKVYPNPSNGSFRIQLPENYTEPVELKLVQPNGIVCFGTTLTGSSNLSVPSLASGMYIVYLKFNNSWQHQTLIIQN